MADTPEAAARETFAEEVARLQREIAERQARLRDLLLGAAHEGVVMATSAIRALAGSTKEGE